MVRRAQDDLGVTDVPTLVFDDEVAVLVRLGAPVEQPGPAARLLGALTALAELATTLRSPPRAAWQGLLGWQWQSEPSPSRARASSPERAKSK